MRNKVGVGLADAYPIYRRRQQARGDLSMHGGRAIAELGGDDVKLVTSVLGDANPAVGMVAARRDGVDHRRCHAATDEPVIAKVRERDACETRFDDIEAPIEAI